MDLSRHTGENTHERVHCQYPLSIQSEARVEVTYITVPELTNSPKRKAINYPNMNGFQKFPIEVELTTIMSPTFDYALVPFDYHLQHGASSIKHLHQLRPFENTPNQKNPSQICCSEDPLHAAPKLGMN